MKFIGIDLAGKEANPTGICILSKDEVKLETLHSDQEIIALVKEVKPYLITIDAPLSLPKGRCCLEKDCRCAEGGHFRLAEREIRSYGPVLPLTFLGMKMLTMRGIIIGKELRKDFTVFETHPRTVQKILGLKDVQNDLGKLYMIPDNPSEHELDALLSAITGCLYYKGCYLQLGAPDEGTIILPRDENCLKPIFIG